MTDAGAWAAGARAAQDAALPAGRILVSATAPVGAGGLGRHLQEIVDALARRGGPPAEILSEDGDLGSAGLSLPRLLKPLGRVSPAWRLWRVSAEYDALAAGRLPAGDHLMGFNGTSLRQFRAFLDAEGSRSTDRAVSVVSATVHVSDLVERHRAARSQYPLERSWATRVVRRNLAEYELAERIFVASEHVRDSFLARGFAEERLAYFPLTPAPRFRPPAQPPSAPTFDVVYVGGLTVDKGVPLLIDAVRRLPYDDLRLGLVGGWKTRAMRRFVGEARARDERIELRPGDPLPQLQGARLYVHAGYSDGFGYAPAEALACGLPVLVSADTGMKDMLAAGCPGVVLPTGDVDALAQAMDAAYRGGLAELAPRSAQSTS